MTQPRDPRGMTARDVRTVWDAASDQDRARSQRTLAELIAEDVADATTPDTFDVPLTPAEEVLDRDDDDDDPSLGPVGVGGTAANVAVLKRVAALLRSWGWTVVFMPGWETRGANRRQLTPDFVGCHHTAAGVDVDRILRDGRSDVPGPLCNLAVHKNSDIVIVAAGPANHFGVATVDSSDAWGIETTGPIPITGTGKAAFPNYRAFLALCVALRVVHDWPSSRFRAHKEVAVPYGRKINPTFNMDVFRTEGNVIVVRRIGEDTGVSKAEVLAGLQEFFNASEIKVPHGKSSNEDLAANLISMGQNEANRDVAAAAADRALAARVEDLDDVLQVLLKAVNTTGWTDEQVTSFATRVAPLLPHAPTAAEVVDLLKARL